MLKTFLGVIGMIALFLWVFYLLSSGYRPIPKEKPLQIRFKRKKRKGIDRI